MIIYVSASKSVNSKNPSSSENVFLRTLEFDLLSLIFTDSIGLPLLSITSPEILPFLPGSTVGVGIGVGDDDGNCVGNGGNVGTGDGEATGVIVGFGVGDTKGVGTGDSVGAGDGVGMGVVETVFVAKEASLPYDVPALFDATMR